MGVEIARIRERLKPLHEVCEDEPRSAPARLGRSSDSLDLSEDVPSGEAQQELKMASSKEQGGADRPLRPGPSEHSIMAVNSYRVVVADDHAVVRHGLRALLESQPGVEVCGEARTGVEAMDGVRREKPDLLVLDLTMPDMNGLEVMRAVRKESPSTDVLVLTMHFSEELAREVLRCGALGYVLKSDADTQLLAALDDVRHHQPFFTNRLKVSMAQEYVRYPPGTAGPGADDVAPGSVLSPRELQMVRLLAEGKSNKELASELGVSMRTIESRRSHIMNKMNFASFSELVRFAVRNKMIED
jgi:DNA-binding NarL/FixJ family response regulator